MTSSPAVECRICKSPRLQEVLNLGNQTLTGVFPSAPEEEVTEGPLRLKWCENCHLLQLGDNYPPGEMYGENYGYRSALNKSMVRHLERKASAIERQFPLEPGDHVVDIGSNDATFLKSLSSEGIVRIGIDPVGKKFADCYVDGLQLIPDFFHPDTYLDAFGTKARLVTSIAMFYDVPDPSVFVDGIFQILADDGVWHFEQSYLPSMLRTNSFDTVCHEHLEYYSLSVIVKLLEKAGLRILDVDLNSVNGGSFAVTAAKADSPHSENTAVINWLLREEEKLLLHTPEPYLRFAERSADLRDSLRSLVHSLNLSGYTIAGYGASTKGNVTLQYCGFTAADLSFLAEVNDFKFGKFSPGSLIPILSEQELKHRAPDFLLMLPWHFREGLLSKESEYLLKGGKFIIPFPYVEIVS